MNARDILVARAQRHTPPAAKIEKPERLRGENAEPVAALVGMFFLVPNPKFADEGTEHWFKYQGHVKAKITETVYLCEYFEWITGGRTHQFLVELGTIISERWALYAKSDNDLFVARGDAAGQDLRRRMDREHGR